MPYITIEVKAAAEIPQWQAEAVDRVQAQFFKEDERAATDKLPNSCLSFIVRS